MFGIPTFDLLSESGKQEFIEYIVNLVRKEINSYTPNYNNPTDGNVLPLTGYYGAFSDYTDQSAALANTAYAMTFNTTDYSNGVRIDVPTSRITFSRDGIYNIQWSGQFENTASQDADVRVWLAVNGINVPGSTGVFTVPQKHGTENGTILPAWNYFVQVFANDYIELYWATTSTTVSIQHIPASTYPSTASLILTAQQVVSV